MFAECRAGHPNWRRVPASRGLIGALIMGAGTRSGTRRPLDSFFSPPILPSPSPEISFIPSPANPPTLGRAPFSLGRQRSTGGSWWMCHVERASGGRWRRFPLGGFILRRATVLGGGFALGEIAVLSEGARRWLGGLLRSGSACPLSRYASKFVKTAFLMGCALYMRRCGFGVGSAGKGVFQGIQFGRYCMSMSDGLGSSRDHPSLSFSSVLDLYAMFSKRDSNHGNSDCRIVARLNCCAPLVWAYCDRACHVWDMFSISALPNLNYVIQSKDCFGILLIAFGLFRELPRKEANRIKLFAIRIVAACRSWSRFAASNMKIFLPVVTVFLALVLTEANIWIIVIGDPKSLDVGSKGLWKRGHLLKMFWIILGPHILWIQASNNSNQSHPVDMTFGQSDVMYYEKVEQPKHYAPQPGLGLS
ncbi:hypothetical protein DFP72DRAFT_1051575 [Ephemerocybe angulata]|uniref:Uncharacterized protein n=1 Tax=Ephemerocybe angulata TaxID=980116 RepID=A0A8H6LXU3_9AGAR|nr:hypothetical protein DFP72DRAFT_1051575 [Tulosesus angulatus]